MCFLPKAKTVEEIVAENSKGMTDAQKAEYWYQLSQNIFALLGKVEITTIEIAPPEWISAAQAQYPTLVNIKIADSRFFTVSLKDLKQILTLDWTNLVPFVSEISDCDKFGTRLYSHLCDYYKINAIVPVWGDTTAGYHGFNLAVVKDGANWIARLVEPQSDAIFIEDGPLGKYIPVETALELGIRKIKV